MLEMHTRGQEFRQRKEEDDKKQIERNDRDEFERFKKNKALEKAGLAMKIPRQNDNNMSPGVSEIPQGEFKSSLLGRKEINRVVADIGMNEATLRRKSPDDLTPHGLRMRIFELEKLIIDYFLNDDEPDKYDLEIQRQYRAELKELKKHFAQ
jgi:hypothetical protein